MRQAVTMILAATCVALLAPRAGLAADFRRDWALAPGFDMKIDTEGYELPTAIAFVPNPGAGPKSPLYFVAELRGKIKVVTRDRTVRSFADVEIPQPKTKYPDLTAQNGAAGLCLDAKHGYVFVTYSAFGRDGALRNAIVRFDTKPGTFGLKAESRLDVKRIFAPFPTSANHQIGGCVVDGDSLFVGVGDGAVSTRARDLDAISGKIIRMTLDGKPHPGNPFAAGTDQRSPRAYVWAYGLRNPFGLTVVDGQLFATQNGDAIDNFLRVERAADYGWQGSDSAIASNATAVINPAVAPVHVAYYPKGAHLFPAKWGGTFFYAASVTSRDEGAGVQSIGYDLKRRWVTRPPSSFVRFRGDAGGEVAAVALGPNGLYFAPILPGTAGRSPVYRVIYDPAARYPYQLQPSGKALWLEYGCAACHSLFGIGGTVGPPLDRAELEKRISTRLDSAEYRKRVAELDRTSEQPFVSFRDERRKVLAEDGINRISDWITYRLEEPRFDDPRAQMPNLGLSKAQARAISAFLLGRDGDTLVVGPKRSFSERVRDVVGSKRFAGGLIVGLGLAAASATVAWLIVRHRRAPAAT